MSDDACIEDPPTSGGESVALPPPTDAFTTPEPDARVGAPPGELRLPDELVYAGVPRVRATVYDADAMETTEIRHFSEIPPEAPPGKTLWVAVEGLADLSLFKVLQRNFGIHPLALEDAISRRSRPKLDLHGDVVMMIAVDPLTPASRIGDVELVTLFLGDGWVLTIEDAPGETFDAVRRRIGTPGSRLRRGGSDMLDAIDERLENLDDSVDSVRLEDVARMSKKLHDIRQSLQKLRRYAAPLREAVNGILRRDLPHIDVKLHPYFIDVTDHLAQIVDHIETARELASSVRDLQFSFVNTRMNEIMRGLTVISTVFLPLSFIASLYGMNFDYMPETKWTYGYPFAIGLMFVVAAFARWFFKKKRWI